MMKMLLLLVLSAWAEPITPLKPCKIGEVMVVDGKAYVCAQPNEWKVEASLVLREKPHGKFSWDWLGVLCCIASAVCVSGFLSWWGWISTDGMRLGAIAAMLLVGVLFLAAGVWFMHYGLKMLLNIP